LPTSYHAWPPATTSWPPVTSPSNVPAYVHLRLQNYISTSITLDSTAGTG